MALIARILTYHPVSIITKPFDTTKLSQGFVQAMNLSFDQPSMNAAINNFSMALQSFEMALNNWGMEEHNRLAFPESVKHFCETRCPMAKTKESIPNNDLGKYQLLNPFSKRGALYCGKRSVCKLWKFLEEGRAKINTAAPAALLRKQRELSPGTSPLDYLTRTSTDIDALQEGLNTLRTEYCTTLCGEKKENLNAEKGDIIFSNFKESLARNSFSYCTHHECPLMLFFEYYRKTII